MEFSAQMFHRHVYRQGSQVKLPPHHLAGTKALFSRAEPSGPGVEGMEKGRSKSVESENSRRKSLFGKTNRLVCFSGSELFEQTKL